MCWNAEVLGGPAHSPSETAPDDKESRTKGDCRRFHGVAAGWLGLGEREMLLRSIIESLSGTTSSLRRWFNQSSSKMGEWFNHSTGTGGDHGDGGASTHSWYSEGLLQVFCNEINALTEATSRKASLFC